MLQEIFYWILNMSITASMSGLLIMTVRAIKKIPRRIAVFLWLIPFLRMTVPLGLNSQYSFMTLLSRITTKTVIVYQPTKGTALSAINCIMAADSYFPITYKVNLLENVFEVASIIWIIVFSAIVLALMIIYFSTLNEIKDAELLRDNIYLSDKVLSPAVYGIIKPRIILPVSYKNKDIELIILHEKIHVRHADNLRRVLAFVIAAAHWFNPLVWIFLKLFLADLELVCDECVLLKIGDDRAKEYALSLLESKESMTVFASAFGGAKIRTRIENILTFRKMTWFSFTASVTLIIVIFYVLLTNAG